MYLLDTNIFLEILLDQGKSDACKSFLNKYIDKIFISDFSLHSIGVILFRYNKREIFTDFVQDVITKIKVLNLPSTEYRYISKGLTAYNLDFDDSYQYRVAKYYELNIVTMDADFKQIKDVDIIFL